MNGQGVRKRHDEEEGERWNEWKTRKLVRKRRGGGRDEEE